MYRFYPTSCGWVAKCLYRDYDGVVRYLQCSGKTKNKARLALDLAVRDRIYVGGNPDYTSDTLVDVIADAWIANLKSQGAKGIGTIQQYEGNLARCLKPGVGKQKLPVRGRLDHGQQPLIGDVTRLAAPRGGFHSQVEVSSRDHDPHDGAAACYAESYFLAANEWFRRAAAHLRVPR